MAVNPFFSYYLTAFFFLCVLTFTSRLIQLGDLNFLLDIKWQPPLLFQHQPLYIRPDIPLLSSAAGERPFTLLHFLLLPTFFFFTQRWTHLYIHDGLLQRGNPTKTLQVYVLLHIVIHALRRMFIQPASFCQLVLLFSSAFLFMLYPDPGKKSIRINQMEKKRGRLRMLICIQESTCIFSPSESPFHVGIFFSVGCHRDPIYF